MDLRQKIRVVDDFPEPGISFKDITTLLCDGPSFQSAIRQIADFGRPRAIDLVVGPEARGFVIGAPTAYALGVGFVPIRKPGKLPGVTIRKDYQLEYGRDGLEIHADAIQPGQRVFIVDDLLATGGTIHSCIELVERSGGIVAGLGFLIELQYLEGRKKLAPYEIFSLIQYEQ
ncbi:adenine phosphoribosyltransferase [Sulfoacidibacillus thermotolerans]|uniref:Adenine phosphoribosyltransferase n=1 Tax=Sulfoacidibacillus thermotolerans TaxID=1765684 RepID=A0A2U3DB68_SULT2|nr:adenine phosphoribosyltransferase [Sulfoacidibacillus thermotolerans]PWI58529.1 adenine phosphoribosyltransferase [Sulfoacidibacillus thermotolerans]